MRSHSSRRKLHVELRSVHDESLIQLYSTHGPVVYFRARCFPRLINNCHGDTLAAAYAIESTKRGKCMNAVIPNLSRSKTISKNTGNTQWQEKKREVSPNC
ncbi:hypothetical protein K0M31_016540 [Melipona bicolor]|uniref:Uncharacterized protein n=1 Tax=Melipona bicolor TaxID=60889 RepID=A0AA40FEF8_9HYME|nr:hypothetical protein K0M31_016540 [Melipona bicolor]